METIKKLKIVNDGFKKISELEKNKKYQITLWKYISTAYGNKLTVTIKDDEYNFMVFLPSRFNNLNFTEIEELNNEERFLVYSGIKENKKGFVHIVDII